MSKHSKKAAEKSLFLALDKGERIPKLEQKILKDLNVAIMYAQGVIKGRWPELEQKLLKNPVPAGFPYVAIIYTKCVIKGRWPELENFIISKNASWAAFDYAVDIIQGPWLEAEKIVLTNYFSFIRYYSHFYPEQLNQRTKDVPLVINKYVIMDVPNTITNDQVVQMFKILFPLCTITPIDIGSQRLLYEPLIKFRIEHNKLKQIKIRKLSKKQQCKLLEIFNESTDFS